MTGIEVAVALLTVVLTGYLLWAAWHLVRPGGAAVAPGQRQRERTTTRDDTPAAAAAATPSPPPRQSAREPIGPYPVRRVSDTERLPTPARINGSFVVASPSTPAPRRDSNDSALRVPWVPDESR